jgi:hypothetical protein
MHREQAHKSQPKKKADDVTIHPRAMGKWMGQSQKISGNVHTTAAKSTNWEQHVRLAEDAKERNHM